MQISDSLIRTKLRPPLTRTQLVPRPRLQTRMAEGFLNPLTLVIAPAGFGKSTLVTASLSDRRGQVAWLSLDHGDNQIGVFLPYLMAALQNADNRIGLEAFQIMAGMRQASTETILTLLINDMDASNQHIILVLDDYQNISNTEVHAAVAFLLDHCPRGLHLVISTRSDPPLPLARLRACGQMVELRAADLRFSEDEALLFLNDMMGLRLEADAVAMLEQRTEGWIAGLQMAALSMRDRDDVRAFIEGFSGTNRHILDYLLEEILSSQPPEIQNFLLCTSILERLSAPLCDAILAKAELRESNAIESSDTASPAVLQSASALKYIEQENLFLISLDEERTWFRYHQLFADLLRSRLRQIHPDRIHSLHIKASVWLQQNGFIREAIQHLISVHEHGRAADLIERFGPGYLAQTDLSIFQMAEYLPDEILRTRPKIGMYQAWLHIIQGRINKALPLLTDIAQQVGGESSRPDQHWMGGFIASALAFLSPPASHPDPNPLPELRLLDEIPADEPILRNAADILYGMALARKGEIERAVEVSLMCIEREKLHQGKPAIPTLASFLSRIYLMLGQLHACAALCHEYLDPIQASGNRFIYTSGSMKIDLGEVLYEWNCLEEAERCIRDGLKSNEPWQNIMTDGFGLIALARVLLARGDFSGALQAVEKLESTLQTRAMPREFDEDFHTLRIRVQLASGNLPDPARWVDKVRLGADYQFQKERYRLIMARIALEQGNFASVQEILAGMNPMMAAGSRITRQLECNLLFAAAVGGQRRLPEAFTLLESCLSLAEPEGYIRVFLDVGKPIQDLLTAYLKSDAPRQGRFAQKVMEAFTAAGKPGISKTPSTGLIEPLSERELEVLRLIALGKTNKEIAQHLIVARGTIKAHAASIYRKLDVSNRTEAVAHARQIGLLS